MTTALRSTFSRLRISTAAALAGVTLATVPVAAHADASIAVEPIAELGNQPAVVFTGDAASTQTYFTLAKPYSERLVQFQHSAPVQVGSGCQLEPGSDRSGVCTAPFAAVLVDAGAGDDTVGMNLWLWNNQMRVEAVPGLATGGPGDDEISGNGPPTNEPGQRTSYALEGGDGADRLRGSSGEDYLDGGGGADRLLGREGSDEVRGGPGDDEVSAGFQGPGDVLDGGDGIDRIPALEDNDYRRNLGVDISVTEDGLANDGEAGENDNVTGVEQLELHGRSVNFSGTEGPDVVFVQAATSTVRGLGGDDRLSGYDGADTLEGGEGADTLEGGFGGDVLDGGPGTDAFVGDTTERNVIASGADRIRARDGVAEQIDCGIDADVAIVDANDSVAASCESVDRGTGDAGGTGAGSVEVGSGAGGGDAAAGPELRIASPRTLGSLLRRGVIVEVRCNGACTVSAALRRGARTVGRRTVRHHDATRLRVEVNRRARRSLASLRRARLVLTVRVEEAGGAVTHVTRRLSFRR